MCRDPCLLEKGRFLFTLYPSGTRPGRTKRIVEKSCHPSHVILLSATLPCSANCALANSRRRLSTLTMDQKRRMQGYKSRAERTIRKGDLNRGRSAVYPAFRKMQQPHSGAPDFLISRMSRLLACLTLDQEVTEVQESPIPADGESESDRHEGGKRRRVEKCSRLFGLTGSLKISSEKGFPDNCCTWGGGESSGTRRMRGSGVR